MPHLIPVFQRRYPNVEITLLEGSNDAIQKALLSGGIDLAIAGFPHPLPGVVLEDYYLEHIVLCLSDGLLAQCGIDLDTHRGEIAAGNLSSLRGCPFVLGSAEDIGGRIGRGLLRSSGVSPVSKATSETSKRCSRSASRASAHASARKICCTRRSRPRSLRTCIFSRSAPRLSIPSALGT